MRGLIAGVVLAAFAGASAVAVAQPAPAQHSEEGMMCLETNGSEAPSTCIRGDVWHDADLCTCDEGTRVHVPVCAPGERPPPDSVSLDKVRKDAVSTGTLEGVSYRGKQICVSVKHPR